MRWCNMQQITYLHLHTWFENVFFYCGLSDTRYEGDNSRYLLKFISLHNKNFHFKDFCVLFEAGGDFTVHCSSECLLELICCMMWYFIICLMNHVCGPPGPWSWMHQDIGDELQNTPDMFLAFSAQNSEVSS